jgi:hypothetical protein
MGGLGGRMRIDPEFYQPEVLRFERDLAQSGLKILPLGKIAAHGYRVIYENTEIVDEPDDPGRYVRFLQAAQVSANFPTISTEAIGWVSRNDWKRYPQGRVHRGEILIEVKGLAAKVAIVPEDFPRETLVTGTLFKLTADEQKVEPYYLLCYLLSKYGKGFRERCLTNTLIGFVSKEELYAIPVPLPPRAAQDDIGRTLRTAVNKYRDFKRSISDAEILVSRVVGLDKLDVSPSLYYVRQFSDLRHSKRFGAEYFMPCKQIALDVLRRQSSRPLGTLYRSVRALLEASRAPASQLVRNFDLTDALEPVLDDEHKPVLASELGSTKKRFERDDVVISRLRSYLREIAIVRTTPNLAAVGSSEFVVLRRRVGESGSLTPEALLIYLRTFPVQTILKWSQDGSQHPRFTERDLLNVPIPDAILDIASSVTSLVNEALKARAEARHLLERGKAALERLVLGREN